MQKNERILRIVMSIILPIAMLLLAREAAVVRAEYVGKNGMSEKTCVVIDAGHGGHDPGKVGVTGCYEKDINMKITAKLKSFLEMEGIEVVLTRDGDYSLCSESDKNKKNTDMKNRMDIIEKNNPVLVVSIHQNSYTSPEIKGAQAFYYPNSGKSRELARVIQERLVATLDTANRRKISANDSYYLLKNISCPTVIVECGFLSNPQECENLETDYYQEKVAWAIYMGIMQYLNAK